MLSCEFCKIFKNIFFTEHLWTTASAKSSGYRTKPLDDVKVHGRLKFGYHVEQLCKKTNKNNMHHHV